MAVRGCVPREPLRIRPLGEERGWTLGLCVECRRWPLECPCEIHAN